MLIRWLVQFMRRACHRSLPWHDSAGCLARSAGFTLLELLVVLALIAIATAGVTASLPDADHTALRQESERLIATLEAARVRSRSTGIGAKMVMVEKGFLLLETGQKVTEERKQQARPWLNPKTRAHGSNPIVLGPEPMLPRQHITLLLGERSITLATDGMQPFDVQSSDVQPSDTQADGSSAAQPAQGGG